MRVVSVALGMPHLVSMKQLAAGFIRGGRESAELDFDDTADFLRAMEWVLRAGVHAGIISRKSECVAGF